MIRGIFGRKGSGKSTRLREIVRAYPRGIVIDPMSEHTGLGSLVTTLDDFKTYWRKMYDRDRWKMVLQPMNLKESSDPLAALRPYMTTIIAAGQDCLVCVDEVDFFANVRQIDPAISHLVNYGRHQGVSLLFAARRPAAVPRELTAQCDELIIFRTVEPRDIAYFVEFIGDAAEELSELPDFQALVWQDGEITVQ